MRSFMRRMTLQQIAPTLARMSATSPLLFTIGFPIVPRPTDPLDPATHLQLACHWEGSGEVFVPETTTSQDPIEVEGEVKRLLAGRSYNVYVPPEQIAWAKVNQDIANMAEVRIYAYRGEKLLSK